MEIRSVCILGGSGFIGRSLAAHLADAGCAVRILTRNSVKARPLLVLPTIELIVTDPRDDAELTRHFEGMDAVVNLVGILHESRRQTFQGVHVDFPQRVVNACRAAAVSRLAHMSALGASSSGPSEYLRSRAAGEAAVSQAAGSLAVTVFRPAVVFGAGDRFLNLFARLVRLFPVLPLSAAHARFQPVWVEDVARAIAFALGDARTAGQTYELCGPRTYSLEELVAWVAQLSGRTRLIVPLPQWAAYLQALAFEFLPGPIMTRDNLASMSVDNVCGCPFPEVFGFQPSALEAVVPAYLAEASVKDRYTEHRYRAGR